MIGGQLHGFVSGGRETFPGQEKGDEAWWKAGKQKLGSKAGTTKVGKLMIFLNRLERLFGEATDV